MNILRRLKGYLCVIQVLDDVCPSDFECFNFYLVFECKFVVSLFLGIKI